MQTEIFETRRFRLERDGCHINLWLRVQAEVFKSLLPMNSYGRRMSEILSNVHQCITELLTMPNGWTVLGKVGVANRDHGVCMVPDLVIAGPDSKLKRTPFVLEGSPDLVIDVEFGPFPPWLIAERAHGWAAVGAREWWRLSDKPPYTQGALLQQGIWQLLESPEGYIHSEVLQWCRFGLRM